MNALARGLRLAFGTDTNKGGVGTGSFVKTIDANANRLGYLIEAMSDPTLNPLGSNLYVRLGLNGGQYEVFPGGYFPPVQLEGWLGDVYVKTVLGTTFAASEQT